MATSSRQDREFNEMLHEHLRNDSTLEKCIEWISRTMNPEDVFDAKDLRQWAEENDFVPKEFG